mmetsp:Transcript_21296/g.61532  ORF Transcript_21296/g.61532 Transcript_21296/m.61532 type:complete len:792 (+) Transcript_21296:81-2456(+)
MSALLPSGSLASLGLARQVPRQVQGQDRGRLLRLVLPHTHQCIAADEEPVLEGDHDRLAVGLLDVAGQGPDVVGVEGRVHLVEHHEGRPLVGVHGEEQRHGGERLLAPGEQVHVAEALRGGHGRELDAAVEGVLRVLKVEVRRAAVHVQPRGVGRQPAVDLANLPGDLFEAVEELIPPGLADRLELGVHVLDVPARQVRVVRGRLHVLGDALHLLLRLEVRAEALELHAQPLQLGAVLLLEHLGRGADGRGLLLLGQQAEVDRHRRGGLRRRPLRRRAGGLARLLREVLQRLGGAAQQRQLDVLEHALAQHVRARVLQGLLLRPDIAEALLHRHQLLALLLGLLAEPLQNLIPRSLHLQTLLDLLLVFLQLRLQRLDAFHVFLVRRPELIHLGLEFRHELRWGAQGPLLECLLKHGELGLQVALPPTNLVAARLGRFLLLPPLAVNPAHIVHAHGRAELGIVAGDGLANLRLKALMFLAELYLLLGQACGLWPLRFHSCLCCLELASLLPELVLAPLEPRSCLAGLCLGPSHFVLHRRQVRPTSGLQRVDLVEPPVDHPHTALGRLQLAEVEARGALTGGLGVHGQVAILRNRLASKSHHFAAKAHLLHITEGQVPTIGHGVGKHDVAQQEFKGPGKLLVEVDTVERKPQRALAVHKLLKPWVRGCRPQIVEGQEGHGGQHALFQVFHTSPGNLARLHHDRIQELAHGHVHCNVQPLLCWMAEIDHTAVHARNRAREVRADLRHLALALQLPFGRGDVLDRVHKLAPFVLQLLLLVSAAGGRPADALELCS